LVYITSLASLWLSRNESNFVLSTYSQVGVFRTFILLLMQSLGVFARSKLFLQASVYSATTILALGTVSLMAPQGLRNSRPQPIRIPALPPAPKSQHLMPQRPYGHNQYSFHPRKRLYRTTVSAVLSLM